MKEHPGDRIDGESDLGIWLVATGVIRPLKVIANALRALEWLSAIADEQVPLCDGLTAPCSGRGPMRRIVRRSVPIGKSAAPLTSNRFSVAVHVCKQHTVDLCGSATMLLRRPAIFAWLRAIVLPQTQAIRPETSTTRWRCFTTVARQALLAPNSGSAPRCRIGPLFKVIHGPGGLEVDRN